MWTREGREKYSNIISFSFLAAVTLALTFALIACSSPLTLEEAIERLEELIPRSQAIEEIVWGAGLESDGSVEYNPSSGGAQYCPVSQNAGIGSLAEIIAELAEIYTIDRASMIMQLAFVGTEEIYPRYGEDGGVIYVDIAYSGKTLGKDIDLSTLRMVNSNPYAAQFEVEYGAPEGDNKQTMTLTLVNEDGVWLLDSPTYYSE